MLLDAPRLVVISIFLVGDTPRPKYHALLTYPLPLLHGVVNNNNHHAHMDIGPDPIGPFL